MYAGPSGVVATVLVVGGGEPSIVATTIAVNAPSHQETKDAFAEVSFAVVRRRPIGHFIVLG